MMRIEDAIQSRDVLNRLVNLVSKGEMVVSLVKSMDGDSSYSINLSTNEKVFVYQHGNGFFSKYVTWFDGVVIDVPNMDSRRLYKTMEQIYKKKEREKMLNKLDKLEKILIS